MPRIRIILEHGEGRPFTPFDRFGFRAWIKGVPVRALLERFAALRAQNLAFLDSLRLDPATLARTGTHPELGRVTLAQLLASWVVHDLGHLAQVVRVLAKRYGGEVGPWRQYSPILDR